MIEEPTRAFGEHSHTETEDDSRNHLQTPWNAEGRDTVDVRAAELDEVLDEDTPSDGPDTGYQHSVQ